MTTLRAAKNTTTQTTLHFADTKTEGMKINPASYLKLEQLTTQEFLSVIKCDPINVVVGGCVVVIALTPISQRTTIRVSHLSATKSLQ